MAFKILTLVCFVASTFAASLDRNSPSTFVLGGEEVQDHSAPYQCFLTYDDEYACGCVILSKKYVITTADCINGRGSELMNWWVVVGNEETEGGLSMAVDSIKINGENSEMKNNIALVEVRADIDFRENVQPIEVAEEQVKEGTELKLTGWGATVVDGPTSPTLRETTLLAASEQECQSAFKVIYDPSIMCTKPSEKKGSCPSDNGSALVANNKLVGMRSAHGPCAANAYMFYVNVVYLRDWIKQLQQ